MSVPWDRGSVWSFVRDGNKLEVSRDIAGVEHVYKDLLSKAGVGLLLGKLVSVDDGGVSRVGVVVAVDKGSFSVRLPNGVFPFEFAKVSQVKTAVNELVFRDQDRVEITSGVSKGKKGVVVNIPDEDEIWVSLDDEKRIQECTRVMLKKVAYYTGDVVMPKGAFTPSPVESSGVCESCGHEAVLKPHSGRNLCNHCILADVDALSSKTANRNYIYVMTKPGASSFVKISDDGMEDHFSFEGDKHGPGIFYDSPEEAKKYCEKSGWSLYEGSGLPKYVPPDKSALKVNNLRDLWTAVRGMSHNFVFEAITLGYSYDEVLNFFLAAGYRYTRKELEDLYTYAKGLRSDKGELVHAEKVAVKDSLDEYAALGGVVQEKSSIADLKALYISKDPGWADIPDMFFQGVLDQAQLSKVDFDKYFNDKYSEMLRGGDYLTPQIVQAWWQEKHGSFVNHPVPGDSPLSIVQRLNILAVLTSPKLSGCFKNCYAISYESPKVIFWGDLSVDDLKLAGLSSFVVDYEIRTGALSGKHFDVVRNGWYERALIADLPVSFGDVSDVVASADFDMLSKLKLSSFKDVVIKGIDSYNLSMRSASLNMCYRDMLSVKLAATGKCITSVDLPAITRLTLAYLAPRRLLAERYACLLLKSMYDCKDQLRYATESLLRRKFIQEDK